MENPNFNTYKTDKSLDNYSKKAYLTNIESFLIDKYFKSPVLDLGCGTGRTTKCLFDKGFDVTGVEIVKEMVEKAKSLFPKIKFRIGDATNLKFKDSSFNTVFFSFNGPDYIHPEEKRIEAFKEISRVLKREGFFVFSSHNPKALFLKPRPNFILRNLKRGTLFSRYKMEQQPFGTLLTHYMSPKKQIEMIERNTDLRFVKMYRKSGGDLHPHYVFVKK